MSKKFEIIGNAVVVTDTVTSVVLLDKPTSVYYDKNSLLKGFITIIERSDVIDPLIPFNEPLAECVNASLTPFTTESFETFART